MTDQAMSRLRRRMIEDMTIRKFAPKTQHDYVQSILAARPTRRAPKTFGAKGLFAMIEKDIGGRDPRRQLINKIEGG